MRIAVLSRNFSVRGGGAERYAVCVAAQLAAHHEVHVFAQNFENRIAGVVYHQIGYPLKRPRWINQLYFAFATWRATRKGFDVVHSHENTWHGDIQTVHVLPVKHNLFADRKGMQRVLRWIKVLSSPRLLTYLALESLRYWPCVARRVVLTSPTLRVLMQTAYPKTAPMLSVIPPGVEKVEGRASPEAQRAARQHLNLPPDGPLLLFVGNDFYKKGLPVLLQALAILPLHMHLAVVGDSSQQASLQKVLAAVPGRVHFLGSLADVAEAYRAADCLVHPTLEDTYAMVVLEGLAHGLPVVVSGARFCGIAAELVHAENAMILQNPHSSHEIADTVSHLFADLALNSRLSDNALQFAKKRTWAAAGLAYQNLIQSR